MEQAAEEIVVGSGRAGVHRKAEEVGESRHNKHVPEHRSGRNARSLRPADLEAQLPAEIGKTGQGCVGREDGLHSLQITEGIQTLHKGVVDLVHFIVKTVERLDEMEFPLRGIEMGRGEDAPGRPALVAREVPGAHPLPEISQRGEHRLKPGQHMFGELAEVGGIFLDFVKDRRLDVRDDQAIEIVEQTAFNDVARQGQTLPVRQRAGIFMPEHAGQQHFMGLLVDFQ